METIRLPFLGPMWFEEARRCGAKRDGEGWYLPPGAVIPPGLAAHISAESDKKRHKVTKSVSTSEPDTLPPADPPRAWTEAEREADIEAGRCALDAIARRNVPDGRRWAVRILERQAAGDGTLCAYAKQLAREALR
jgi:hypothetical protein